MKPFYMYDYSGSWIDEKADFQ